MPMSNINDHLHLGGKEDPALPREPTRDEVNALKQKYENAGQEQVFAFFDELKSTEKAQLFQQLSKFDPNRINELANKALNPAAASQDGKKATLEPLPESSTASMIDSDTDCLPRFYASGLQLIAANKVAVVLMAGGQGTRLGSAAPKGCFDIGLPSKKSLFQIQAERIIKLQKLARESSGKDNVVIPWYVMTSGPTRQPTQSFFEEHNFFGLDKKNVIIFEQGVLPCISNEGKILMESKSKVYISCFLFLGGFYQPSSYASRAFPRASHRVIVIFLS